MTPNDRPAVSARDVTAAIWVSVAVLLLAIAVLIHAIFPRYDYRVVGDDGRAIVIYDRWSGRFQRVSYNVDGEPTLTRVVTPF